MSCKHEFVEAQGTKMDYEKNDNGRIETLIRRKVCWKCYKTKTEIDLEQQLATANTNNKALREENELLRHKAAGNDATMLRAELVAANARVAELEETLSEVLAVFRDEEVTITEEMKARWLQTLNKTSSTTAN